MAHLQCIFYSKALEMDTCVHVILPNEGDLTRTKVVYLLHGLSDNYSAWCRYSNVERYALSAGVAVIPRNCRKCAAISSPFPGILP